MELFDNDLPSGAQPSPVVQPACRHADLRGRMLPDCSELRAPQFNTYIEGVEWALKSGCIAVEPDRTMQEYGKYGLSREDPWSHFTDGLHELNGRACCELLVPLARAGGAKRLIELGPGAGVALSWASKHLPDVEIETVSLTPINPYLRFKVASYEQYRQLCPWNCSLEAAVPQGEARENEVFERLDKPYIAMQHIGRFPHQVRLPAECYDVIYENTGVLFHQRPGESAPRLQPNFPKAARAVRELMSPGGVMLLRGVSGEELYPFVGERSMVATFVERERRGTDFIGSIIFGPENRLPPLINEFLGGAGGPGVLQIPDYASFRSFISALPSLSLAG